MNYKTDKRLRDIAKDEIVIEFDDCSREEGLEWIELTKQKIGKKFKYSVYDHGGKSPHLHIKNINGLKAVKEDIRKIAKKELVEIYAGNPEKVDYSLTSKHKIAKEGVEHFKKTEKPGCEHYGIKELIFQDNPNVNNSLPKGYFDELLEKEKLYENECDVDIVGLCKEHNMVINNNQMRCPHKEHEDSTPSCHIYPITGTAYCFGCRRHWYYVSLKEYLKSLPPKDIGVLKDKELFTNIQKQIGKFVNGDVYTVKLDILALCSVYVDNVHIKPHMMKSGSSSSGKSYTSKAVCKFWKETNRIHMFSSITDKALKYYKANDKKWSWDGKLLYVEDASQSFMNSEIVKVLLSDGMAKSLSVVDGKSQVLEVNGKPLMWTTTANVDLGDEMATRFIVSGVDETDKQLGGVLKYQSEIAEGEKSPKYDNSMQNVLKALENVKVIIPYASKLKDIFIATGVQRVKRDYPRFLALIMAHTALYQHQREKDDNGYLIATKEDYDVVAEIFQKKILDNNNFFGLSHREQVGYEKCKTYEGSPFDRKEKDSYDWFSTKEIVAHHPVVSEVTWRRWLMKFVSLGLLETRTHEEKYNTVSQYMPVDDKKITITGLLDEKEEEVIDMEEVRNTE
jgi:hypothetical protein